MGLATMGAPSPCGGTFLDPRSMNSAKSGFRKPLTCSIELGLLLSHSCWIHGLSPPFGCTPAIRLRQNFRGDGSGSLDWPRLRRAYPPTRR